MPEEVTLEFVGRQLEQLSNRVAGLEDQVTVLTAMMRRLDDTAIALADEVRSLLRSLSDQSI
jgi:hypothetical protein